MIMPVEAGWHLLVISLPSTSATARMRIWRALKGRAAVLRDGVYLLPHQDGLSDRCSIRPTRWYARVARPIC